MSDAATVFEHLNAIDLARSLNVQLKIALQADSLDVLPSRVAQELLATLCQLYAANMQAGNKMEIVGRGDLTETDAMIASAAILRALDLQVFELGMWQSWVGR